MPGCSPAAIRLKSYQPKWNRQMILRPLDREALRQQYVQASPFPFANIEQFLDPVFAGEVSAAFPSFDEAASQGKAFRSVNERKKISDHRCEALPAADCAVEPSACISRVSFVSLLYYRYC